jgi:tetratricopeptide (TPR) repeat protein
MIIRNIIIIFCFALFALASAEQKGSLEIPCEKRALDSSLRCLETIRGDEERIASTRNWVAENLTFFGNEQLGISVLRNSEPHYRVPSGCVDSAVVALGNNDREAVHRLLELGLDLLPYAAGRGSELVQFQILRIATVIGDTMIIQRAWEADNITHADLKPAYSAFLKYWKPNRWDQILDFISPDRSWQELQKNSSREIESAWKAERAVDYYTALIFLREAQARICENKRYPASWLRFVEAAIRSPAINSRPALLSKEMARLALLEGHTENALKCIQETWELISGWGPNMSGVYSIERDVALTLGKIPEAGDRVNVASERLLKRAKILCDNLDSYEQLLQLPLLAEGLQSLGKTERAKELWQKSAKLCGENQNPESQSIGLTRLWMSFARANIWPEKETEALLLKIEKKLPEAYSKVHF